MARSINTIANEVLENFKKEQSEKISALLQKKPDASPMQIQKLTWKKRYYGCVPYLEAMYCLNDISDKYMFDSGSSIIRYFLSNVTSWKGDTAKRIKAELNAMLKGK
jgi:hypothetical protein